MSITVKAEQIDAIIHKYMLEMGYLHSAYLFEHEANIKILGSISKTIQPNALPKICEQALILRSLEIHEDLEESMKCTEEIDLLHKHSCQITKKHLKERRAMLAKVNEQAAVQLKNDLRIQEEARKRELQELENMRKQNVPQSNNRERFNDVQLGQEENELSDMGIEGESDSNFSEQSTPQEKPKKKRGRPPKNKGKSKSEAQKKISKFNEDNLDTIEEAKVQEFSPEANLDIFTLTYPDSYTPLQTYRNGNHCFILFKDVQDNKVQGYIVSEISSDGKTLTPVFVLPAGILSSDPSIKVEIQLKKHLILSRSDGVLNFIDYESRQFVGYLEQFKSSEGTNLSISHDERLNIYIISSEDKTIIFEDFSFEEKLSIQEKVLDVGVGITGSILFLLSNNKIVKKSLTDKNIEECIEVPEGHLKALKYGPNSIYFAAKVSNPYSINIWTENQTQNLFSFNENAKFDDFLISGDFKSIDHPSKVDNYVVCFDKTYLKFWNIDTGSFIQEYDYSRKILKDLISLNSGRYVVASQERGSKLRLIDIATKKDFLLLEGEEDISVHKLGEDSMLVIDSEEENGKVSNLKLLKFK